MKTSPTKITLSPSQDIPFNKLILSQANVRRIKAGISVEDLAEDIARRGLLQGLSVRPVRDPDGSETGMYEIPAGGRRYRALELLVKQKRMAKTQPVPCVVRTEGLTTPRPRPQSKQVPPWRPRSAAAQSDPNRKSRDTGPPALTGRVILALGTYKFPSFREMAYAAIYGRRWR
jgi:ParB family chromosome partitioning protein